MTYSEFIKESIDDITKGAEDKRAYRGLKLQNGMKVLLISDASTDKSAASMDVQVGHMSDPELLPGLAHFCEHMLFLGTEKYPSENEYNKFLSEHGGTCNAYTAADHTNYHFDVTPDNLAGILDRFAQFFLQPLFTVSATDREVNAVHSEFEKNIPSDSWRMNQLEKHTSKMGHPYRKFSTGNKDTLLTIPKEKGINIHKELLDFHSTWYSSNIMGLCVLGKDSLDELQEMVLTHFKDVCNKEVTVPEWTEHPFGPDEKKKQGYVVPVKDIRTLNITFPIPDLRNYYRTEPGHYLSHLIGHEGPGSLLSLLKAEGWVNYLYGGQKTGPRGFDFFVVNVDLTEEGINHVEDIVTHVFQYLNMLKDAGPQEWVFEECRKLYAMQFRFKDKERPQSYVTSLSGALHYYPLMDVLSSGYILTEWKPELVEMVMSYLTPENVRIAVVGKKFDGSTTMVEPWYGTCYSQEPIPENVIKKWENVGTHEKLRLPDQNEFIPSNFELVPREPEFSELPVLLKSSKMSRVWFKLDNKFLLPKAVVRMEFKSPFAYLDPLNYNMTYMFVHLFQDALNEYAYAAELAGLSYNLSTTKYGMILSMNGFNDKQYTLLEKLVDKMTSFTIDKKRFDILREAYIRSLRNFAMEQPYHHAAYYLSSILVEHSWTNDELLAATEDLTIERVEQFIPVLLSRLHLECLIHGNISSQGAIQLVEMVESKLQVKAHTKPLCSGQLLKDREYQLPDTSHFAYETENSVHRSSCIETYFQCGLESTRSNVLVELFCQIINEPCFNTLRTQEQLGYIVWSGVRRGNGVQGVRVLVQSERSPRYVDGRIEAFLLHMEDYIKNLKDSEFEKHRDALVAIRLEKPKKLSHQAAQYWSEIMSQQYNFDRPEVEVPVLKLLTKEDVLNFYKDLISHQSNRRHKLAVHVKSVASGGAFDPSRSVPDNQSELINSDGLQPAPITQEPTKIESIAEFKRRLGLFPLVQPYIKLDVKSKL